MLIADPLFKKFIFLLCEFILSPFFRKFTMKCLGVDLLSRGMTDIQQRFESGILCLSFGKVSWALPLLTISSSSLSPHQKIHYYYEMVPPGLVS